MKDERRAVAMMREAAKAAATSLVHLRHLGACRGSGGIKSDLAQAALWIKKAADTGHEEAAIRYADILLCGIGCARTPPLASAYCGRPSSAAAGGR